MKKRTQCLLGLLTFLPVMLASAAIAKDTDIYRASNKQNMTILLDTSGSMLNSVYEHSIDYGAMYDYLFTKNDEIANPNCTWGHPSSTTCAAGDYKNYIYDPSNGTKLYKNHYDRNKIYLAVFYSSQATTAIIQDASGNKVAVPADLGSASWRGGEMEVCAELSDTGKLVTSTSCSKTHHLTEGGDGSMLLDNKDLGLGAIKKNDITTYSDGTVVDLGFVGLLQAPGYVYSGYFYDNGSFKQQTASKPYVYFFVTGNYLNFLHVQGLVYYKENVALPYEERYKMNEERQLRSNLWPYPQAKTIRYNSDWSIYTLPCTIGVGSAPSYCPKYILNNGVYVCATPPYCTYNNYRSGGTTSSIYFDPVYNNWYLGSLQTDRGSSFAYFYESFPQNDPSLWKIKELQVKYPEGSADYANELNGLTSQVTITPGTAVRLQVHFSEFDVKSGDEVQIYNKDGEKMATYTSLPADGWSDTIEGNTAHVRLVSDASGTGKGYSIDKIRYLENDEGYRIQSRLDAVQDAVKYVVDAFGDKISWGLAQYDKTGNADGGDVLVPLDLTKDDTEQQEEIKKEVDKLVATGGTPMGEALQDTWYDGFYQQSEKIAAVPCRKNFIIHMTDGYPSSDDKWGRIPKTVFQKDTSANGYPNGIFYDKDGDGWIADPGQYDNPPANFTDDLQHWMYTHSIKDGSLIPESERGSSYENVRVHNIAFGGQQNMLKDASASAGGQYLVAANKDQLVAAFAALARESSASVAFSAPSITVDSQNKMQSSSDLYMGLFLPKSDGPWYGNIKHYKSGDGSTARPDSNKVYGYGNQIAIGGDGAFLPTVADYWGDPERAASATGSGVISGGAGEKLLLALKGHLEDRNFWKRPIYTSLDGKTLVPFSPENTELTAEILGASDSAERNRIINFTHGYTSELASDGQSPVAVRPWVIGPIIHSQPVSITYYDTTDSTLPSQATYIAVGSNDGMIHVICEESDKAKTCTAGGQTYQPGDEVFAFIPTDILPKLKDLVDLEGDYLDTVDGPLTVYSKNAQPTYLIFGERRGGRHYWCLNISDQDPAKWKVQWDYTNPELGQTWGAVQTARILSGALGTDGSRSYQDVAIFSGGYDDIEDNYPEPFTDPGTGHPFEVKDGKINYNKVTDAWSKATQDLNGNGKYDIWNGQNSAIETRTPARGIFVVDIDDPTKQHQVSFGGSKPVDVLPFSVTWDATGVASGQSTGVNQKRSDMKYSIPATPKLVSETILYYKKDEAGELTRTSATNVLNTLYVPDMYANLFKARLDLQFENKGTADSPNWQLEGQGWVVDRIFSSNPGYGDYDGNNKPAAGRDVSVNNQDQGRKTFYSPSISWGGTKNNFEASNFHFGDEDTDNETITEFPGTDAIASLFFGTGDREHPLYAMVHNRMYAVYDDTALKEALQKDVHTDEVVGRVPVTSAPYTEKNLLNLTCDELDTYSTVTKCYLDPSYYINDDPTQTCAVADDIDAWTKTYLREKLYDDAVYAVLGKDAQGKDIVVEHLEGESGTVQEDDAKGWFIVLDRQGDTTACSHMKGTEAIDAENKNTSDRHNHWGEQILSEMTLFYGTLYYTSYQPNLGNPCESDGNGFAYAIRYEDTSATYNYGSTTYVANRSWKYPNIAGIPTGFSIVFRGGEVQAVANMGGQTIGAGNLVDKVDGSGSGTTAPGLVIDSPPMGLEMYYWRDSNSQVKGK